jgi:DNA-directed RNA polymerase specialized sigma24 family protein
MSEVTRILSVIEQGDRSAAEQQLSPVYQELRRLAGQWLAREAPGQTLQPTALVHEAYVRLVDVYKVQHWNSRGHFFRRRLKPCGGSSSTKPETSGGPAAET